VTKLVPDGSTKDVKYVPFPEVRRAIINANPLMAREWKHATEKEEEHRAGLSTAGVSITRHTGGYSTDPSLDVAPDSPEARWTRSYTLPEDGTRLEGAINWAMSRRDKLLRAADIKIRDAIIKGLLTPRSTYPNDQAYRIYDHDWAREIAPPESDDQHIHRGSLYMEGPRGRLEHVPICFDLREVDRLIQSKTHEERATIVEQCKSSARGGWGRKLPTPKTSISAKANFGSALRRNLKSRLRHSTSRYGQQWLLPKNAFPARSGRPHPNRYP
jgi:hypothetical protein